MIFEEIYNQYFNSLISGKRDECRSALDHLIAENYSIQDIYVQLFQRSLYQVGDYWEKNMISVATEHLATAITESMMIVMQPQLFSIERTGKRAIISCVANEFHQIGAKMIADIFELNGWDGYFLGANTPVNGLLDFVDKNNPDIIGLSLSIYFNIAELISALEKVKHNFPHIPVIVGGQAFRWGGADIVKKYDNVHLLNSVVNLENFLTNY